MPAFPWSSAIELEEDGTFDKEIDSGDRFNVDISRYGVSRIEVCENVISDNIGVL